MKVYKVKFESMGSPTCVWLTRKEACEEVYNILEDATPGDEISIKVVNTTKKLYNTLREFEGY